MRRRQDDDEDGASSGSGSEDESVDEVQKMVRAYNQEKAAAKKASKRGRKGKGGRDDADDEEELESRGGGADDLDDGEGNLFIVDSRAHVDGSKKLLGVDGEEDMADDVEADLGIKVEPFHLREEMETGHFTEDGMYVRRGFDGGDAWLDEQDELEQGKKPSARSAKKHAVRFGDNEKEDDSLPPPATPAQLAAMVNELHGLLQERETVTGALNRLAKEKRAARDKMKDERVSAKKEQHSSVVGGEFKKPISHPARNTSKDAFDRVTELADRLLQTGTHSIYEMDRAALKGILNAKKRTAKIYQYVIRGAGSDGGDSDVFGPFSVDQLGQWHDYLSQHNNVDIRLTIGGNRQWRPYNSVDFERDLDGLN